jgi:SAM-dependent methyltransferase
MALDISATVATYYDLNPDAPVDGPFYAARIRSPHASVLELGCGTGRVLLPLAEHCMYIHGLDASEAMLAICRAKLKRAGIPVSRAEVTLAEITEFRLGREFDLVLAPYRLAQNLAENAELEGFFRSIRTHLSPIGTCVLNVARPKGQPDELRRSWVTGYQERLCWERPVADGRVTCHERRAEMDEDRLVLYPELIWRRYEADALVGETMLRIPMRCHYPKEFTELVQEHGFRILRRWGGFSGEAYGSGPELIVEIQAA